MADSGKKEGPKAPAWKDFDWKKDLQRQGTETYSKKLPERSVPQQAHIQVFRFREGNCGGVYGKLFHPKRPFNTASDQAAQSTVPDGSDSSASKISAVTAEDGTKPSITAAVPDEANTSLLPIQKIKASYTQNGPDKTEIDETENPLERKPICVGMSGGFACTNRFHKS
ncbi:hypothetical protein EBB54_30255 [Schaedlerella arabinosiphila]|uniref:Uncharacterized protein n=1 Tax=Schaedlerella arabinosiphila TaxID=2044587 RepID=A0A426DBB4_9FIRM|nr:hypothetical protein [Schaedlerella arabinosiphila]RRK25026.1 hypothetical protein EBB54_30255 [Schaedlerella arabinosiphila]